MAAGGSFAIVTSAVRSHPAITSESSVSFCSSFSRGYQAASCNVGLPCVCKSSAVGTRSLMQIAHVGERDPKTERLEDRRLHAEMSSSEDSERLLSHSTAEPGFHGGREISQQMELPHGLDKQLLPQHVAIIMDGNSRWAERRGLPVSAGHEAGVMALREVVYLSSTWGIRALTVFAFSTENWLRPKVEVIFLMRIFEEVLREELPNFVKKNIQVRVIGDIGQLPERLQGVITAVEKATQENNGLKLSVAVGYSGRNDIVQACQQIAVKIEKGQLKPNDITESLLDDELGTSWMGVVRNPDLLIRTSGEQRLSNFLLWQLAYTELFFLDAHWPEVGEAHYANALLSYQRRNRRYGRRLDLKNLSRGV